VCRARTSLLNRQASFADEARQRLFERERPVVPRHRDFLMQVLQRVLAHMLTRADSSSSAVPRPAMRPPSFSRHEDLRHDRGERHDEFLPDRRLTFGWKRV
jgi:hypothetical protein